MEKIKRLLGLLFQLVSLALLLLYLSHGGLAVIFGGEVMTVIKTVVAFGVSVMSLAGIAVSYYLPTRRHRILKTTENQNAKYIWVLMLYQTLMWIITMASGSMTSAVMVKFPALLMNVIILTFAMIAFMMPFNYIKSLFNLVKTVEYRDPRNLFRQFFS